MKKKTRIDVGDEKIARNLNIGDLNHLNGCLDKVYAFTYGLHSIAESDGLEDLGDHDALIILDEIVVQLHEVMRLINKGANKKKSA
jgi:hypothetical protein